MALVFFDGCQDAQTAPKPEYVQIGGGFPNATGRDGSTAGALIFSGASYLNFTLGSTTLLMGFAIKPISNMFGNTATEISWAAGSTFLLHMGITSAGFLEFRRGADFNSGTVVGITSGHAAFVDGVWRHVQIKYIPHTTNGTLLVKVDGTTVLSVNGVQTASAALTPSRWYHSTFNNFGSMWSLDDMWVADDTDGSASQGRANNDLLGDLKVATLLPSNAGDSTQWTPSTGANYAAVDEVPTNTTDYVSTSGSGNRDLYLTQDLPSNATAVYGLRVGLYAEKSDAGLAQIKPVIKESGGSVTVQSALTLLTSYAGLYGALLYLKPSNGAVFSVSDVNGIQIGVELG